MKWLHNLFRPKATQPTINENVPATVTAVPGGYRCVPDKPTILSDGETTIDVDVIVQSIVDDFTNHPDCWKTEQGTFSPETMYYTFYSRNGTYTLSHFVHNNCDIVRIVAMSDDELTEKQQNRLRNVIKTWRDNRNTKLALSRKQQSVESLKILFPHAVIEKESHV